jgi:hypothetical protein
MSIDGGASGTPLDLRVARSANGDGFAVWRADNGNIVQCCVFRLVVFEFV